MADDLLLIVTGSTLAAEAHDRPAAYALRDRISGWLEREGKSARVRPLVCSDVWWLNDPSLRERPTVSVGGPEVNALTAYLADKLPTAFAIDGALMVQMDVEFGDLLVACWGIDHAQTARAVGAFVERYMLAFLEAAMVG